MESETGATGVGQMNPAALTVAQASRLLGVAEQAIQDHVSAGAAAIASAGIVGITKPRLNGDHSSGSFPTEMSRAASLSGTDRQSPGQILQMADGIAEPSFMVAPDETTCWGDGATHIEVEVDVEFDLSSPPV